MEGIQAFLAVSDADREAQCTGGRGRLDQEVVKRTVADGDTRLS